MGKNSSWKIKWFAPSVWKASENMVCDLGTMQFFYSFKSVTPIWGYFVAGCSPTTLNFIV